MAGSKEPVELFLIYVTETADAVRFTQGEMDDEREEGFWLPKSQISGYENMDRGDSGEVLAPEWLALQEGLI